MGWNSRPLALISALAITLGLTVYPRALAPDGTVNHALLTLLMWGVAAGFVYGVGYVPESRVWRWLLGPTAAFAFMAAGLSLSLWRLLGD